MTPCPVLCPCPVQPEVLSGLVVASILPGALPANAHPHNPLPSTLPNPLPSGQAPARGVAGGSAAGGTSTFLAPAPAPPSSSFSWSSSATKTSELLKLLVALSQGRLAPQTEVGDCKTCDTLVDTGTDCYHPPCSCLLNLLADAQPHAMHFIPASVSCQLLPCSFSLPPPPRPSGALYSGMGRHGTCQGLHAPSGRPP